MINTKEIREKIAGYTWKDADNLKGMARDLCDEVDRLREALEKIFNPSEGDNIWKIAEEALKETE